MQEFILVAEKLFIGFLALIFVINISGKGNLAPSTASDAVQNYVLGGIIGGVIYNDNIKIWEYLAILAIWCGMVLLLRYVKTHNVKMKQVLDGIALPVVDEGAILYDNCKKLGLSAHDLSFKLRTNRVYSVTEVKRAVCEQNGQLIIVKYGEENPKFPPDYRWTPSEKHSDHYRKRQGMASRRIEKAGLSKHTRSIFGRI